MCPTRTITASNSPIPGDHQASLSGRNFSWIEKAPISKIQHRPLHGKPQKTVVSQDIKTVKRGRSIPQVNEVFGGGYSTLLRNEPPQA